MLWGSFAVIILNLEYQVYCLELAHNGLISDLETRRSTAAFESIANIVARQHWCAVAENTKSIYLQNENAPGASTASPLARR